MPDHNIVQKMQSSQSWSYHLSHARELTEQRCCGCSVLGAQVAPNQRRSVLVDLLTVHGAGGKAIVFTDRKRDADEVAAAVALSMPCEVRPPML